MINSELKPGQLIGVNYLRILAVFLMFITHTFRTQVTFRDVYKQADDASVADQALMFFMKIEPLTSAIFLFLVGFSLVLSWYNRGCPQGLSSGLSWVKAKIPRMLSLYLIAVVMFIVTHGLQWTHLFFSPGILSVIAISAVITSVLVITPNPWLSLLLAIVWGVLLSWYFDASGLYVAGLNSGAGGVIPLINLALLGALFALVFCRWKLKGMIIISLIGAVISLLSLGGDYPWIMRHTVDFKQYTVPQNEVLWASLLDLLGKYKGHINDVNLRFWNHSCVFIFRTMGILGGLICLFIGLGYYLFTSTDSRNGVFYWLNRLGQRALTLYVFHLIILAIVELSGLKPANGWQTWLMVFGMLLMSPLVINLTDRYQYDQLKSHFSMSDLSLLMRCLYLI